MACSSPDEQAWNVRDSSELWRPGISKQATTSPPHSYEGVAGRKETSSAVRKQCKLPPRSPRTVAPNSSAENGDLGHNLELKVQPLSPRPPLVPKLNAASAKSSDQRKVHDAPYSDVSCSKVLADPPSARMASVYTNSTEYQQSPVKSDDTSIFAGVYLENQMLTDDSEADFWDYKLDDEDVTGFHSLSKAISSRLPTRLMHEENSLCGLNGSTTICTLNGERVIMQTNLTFQEDTCPRAFERAMNPCDGARKTNAFQESISGKVQPRCEARAEVTGPAKRRWPRMSRHTAAYTQPRAAKSNLSEETSTVTDTAPEETNEDYGSKATGKRLKHSRTLKKALKASVKSSCRSSWPKPGQDDEATGDNTTELQADNQLEEVDQAVKVDEQSLQTTEALGESVHGTEAAESPKQGSCPFETIFEKPESTEAVVDSLAKESVLQPEKRISLSKEKFSNILSFLKQVEDTNFDSEILLPTTVVAEDHSPRTVLEPEDAISLAESNLTTTSLGLAEEASRTKTSSSDSAFNGIKKKIQELKGKIVKQSERITELEADNESLKVQKHKEISLERERYSKELQDQAADYKAGIKKHLSISEKLMKDKEALSERCSDLTNTLNKAESKFEDRLKVAKEQWNTELKRLKEAWNAGEKSRRDAWIEKKTKEIKEMTIVGLEPHIESIHECHKKELESLHERHSADLAKCLQKQNNQNRQEMSQMREHLLKERDDLLDKERLATHARFNEMAEKYEQQALQQRMRIANDLAQQLERSEGNRRDDKQYAQEMLGRLQKEAAEREEALRRQHEKALGDQITKAQAEISALVASMDSERREWQRTINDRVQKELSKREEAVRERCIKERNKEIEMILDRMETEKLEAVAVHRRELSSKMEEMQVEKKALLKKTKDNEGHFRDLCKEVWEAKTAAEEERSELLRRIDELNAQAKKQAEAIVQLEEQVGHEKLNIKKEREKLEGCLLKQEELLNSTRMDLASSREDLEQLRVRKVQELAELESRVKVAIERKDEIIWGLRNQLETAHHQIRHTEQLLQHEHSILFG